MTEEKQFIRWMAFVTFIIFGVAKGIPAAIILWVPEPLPKMSANTAWSIDHTQMGRQEYLLADLDHEYYRIWAEATIASGFFLDSTDCGAAQWDVGRHGIETSSGTNSY